jgi:hypothetical protein
MNIVYVNTKPSFAIGRDQYQWILSLKRTNRGEWGENNYFPKMSLLLEELAEQMFRKNVIKIKELKDLDGGIQKTYDLISDLSVDLERTFLDGVNANKDKVINRPPSEFVSTGKTLHERYGFGKRVSRT